MTLSRDASEIQQGLRPHRPLWRRTSLSLWRFTTRYPFGAFSAVFVVLLVTMAVFPSPFATHDPLDQVLPDRLQGPSLDHWFGTDSLGRDLYSRIIFGTRTAITIGFGIVIFTQGLALIMGTVSGYYGGWFDTLFQRLIDIGIAIPGLVFIILAVQALRQQSVPLLGTIGDTNAIILGVGVVIVAGASRTIRGVTLQIREEQFVEAAQAMGASNRRIMLRHIVPNLFPILIVSASIFVGAAVLIESSLSFLGIGVQPPTPSWGLMLNDARSQLVRAPHIAIFPGLAILLTVYSFNMLGDALRDKLDPRLRGTN